MISAFSNREKEVSDKVELQEHVMPNGEFRVVKSLKKRKRQINQTDDDKKVLQEGASVLSDRFNNR